MPFVSYAQNGEDVLLWRALQHLGAGFYVDVGAAHPDEDSVTRAFYDRGWRGINIEPVKAMAARIAAARTRDVTLAVAAGATEGTITLHAVAGTGLSTTDPAAACALADAGMQASVTTVPMRTLGSIMDEYAPASVHFLKIDVEGAEHAVLLGLDLRRHRPWVILVEATLPMTTIPSHHEWEELLIAADYQFVLFDGLNRFYVAGEWAAALAGTLSVPVNVGDDYIRVSDAPWARRTAQQDAAAARAVVTEATAQAAYARAFEHARDLGVSQTRLSESLRLLEAETRHSRAIEAMRDSAVAQGDAMKAELEAARDMIAAVYRSTSWRVTGPLRTLARLARPNDGPVCVQPALIPEAELAGERPPEETRVLKSAPQAVPVRAGRLRRTIHQFHSGSATGDAVTNSLLLIQTQLRKLGYRSDIFVQHRDPVLAGALRLIDEIPAGDDHIMIVHHSMGHDGLDTILSSGAPKILYYHNITPEEYLPDILTLRHYGALGRKQLTQLRGFTLSALAASEFNAIELRQAGFRAVEACTLLFDLDTMRATAGRAAPRTCFTVLFVGRVIESKGQADLIDAFAHFKARFEQPARLVLVGRTDSPGNYLAELDARIRAHGLQAAVVVTGPLPDAALKQYYEQADLYVSLSHHEGFGVPLAEASAHGIPVLAWPAGAVGYVFPGTAGLLSSRDPAYVAGRMLAIAEDQSARTGLVQDQAAALDRFAWQRQWPAMQNALARAGAEQPLNPDAAHQLQRNMRFSVVGHGVGSYSLAAVNCGFALALDAERPGRVRFTPVEGAPLTDFSHIPAPARALTQLGPFPAGPVVVISNHYPVHVPDEPGDICLALVFWEESVVPRSMIERLEAGFAGVLAPTRFVAKALVDSGLTVPVHVVGQAPALERFEALARERRVAPPHPLFTFLHVSSCFPRKGVDVLLSAYARAFRSSDPVLLIIKGFPNPHNDVGSLVDALMANKPDAPAIEFINAELTDDEVLALYRRADAMVLPSRGEGLNLPAAEAMAAGLPLIVTGYGGQLDFCDPSTARLLRYRLRPAQTHLASNGSLWAEPDEDDLVAALTEVEAAARDSAGRNRLSLQTGRARVAVAQALDRRRMVARLESAALGWLMGPAPPPVRIAWVSSWGVRCGVAEYTRKLIAAMPSSDAIDGHVVLADERTQVIPATDPANGWPHFVTAWTIDEPAGHDRLPRAIMRQDADVVVIQHHPGLMRWNALAALLTGPALTSRTAVVTLHATHNLSVLDRRVRDEVCAALAGVARIVVHTLADLHRLQDLGLADNVTLVPHGARAALPARQTGDARSSSPVIGSYGFFLPGKGIGVLISALAIVRNSWLGARLKLVNADFGAEGSAMEISRCRELAASAGLSDVIDWHTEFLPDERSLDLLSSCDLIVVPTQASHESASGAARMALAAGPPVLVTHLPLFDDLEQSALRADDCTADALAQSINRLLTDRELRETLRRASSEFTARHGWDVIGKTFASMLTGLARTHYYASRGSYDERHYHPPTVKPDA